jgi:hypothetical protein
MGEPPVTTPLSAVTPTPIYVPSVEAPRRKGATGGS